jgi:hypothetical protein
LLSRLLAILIATLLSSLLYRLGGQGKPFNTKYRDLGCPTVLFLLLWFLFGFHWIYFLVFGLSFGALTTYWDFIFKYDNFWFTGFMYGLAGIPLCWFIPWWIPVVRLIICTVGCGLISKLSSNVWVEECGRGAFFIL